MEFTQLSLSNRLLLVVSLVLTAFLGVSAFSLNNAFQASADSAHQKKLENDVYTLLAAAEFDQSGFQTMRDSVIDRAFSIPNSGLYAQITSGREIIWQSKSSLGLFLALPEHPGPANTHVSTIELNTGVSLFNLAYGFIWQNDHGEQFNYTLNVAEDLNALQQQKADFQRSLWYWLGGTGLMLLIAQAVILRWGLRPLHDVAIDLRAIESGDHSRLSKNYPKELNQLTHNINILLDQEESRRERYKNSLADLAHSLKTPLAVFHGDLENSSDIAQLKQSGYEQLERINSLVDYQLQRAATEGKSSLLAPVSLGEIIHKILLSLDKVYQSKQIHSQREIAEDVFIHANEADMYELLGNLLENAYKYCNKQVNVYVTTQLGTVQIYIEDDGNGISPDAQVDIIKRGKRLDTQVEGHGLGLTIASDIVDAYQGELKVESSHLGGARFIIQLPNR